MKLTLAGAPLTFPAVLFLRDVGTAPVLVFAGTDTRKAVAGVTPGLTAVVVDARFAVRRIIISGGVFD